MLTPCASWITIFRVSAPRRFNVTARTQIAARTARSALAARPAVARLAAVPATSTPATLRAIRAYATGGPEPPHTQHFSPPPPSSGPYEQPKRKGRFRRILGNVVKLTAVVFVGATAFFLYGE